MPSNKIFRTPSNIMLALAAIALQVIIVCNAQFSGSTSGIPLECLDCKPDDICAEMENGTKYCKRPCIKDCTGKMKNWLCASDGKNYPNKCEMENAACEQSIDIILDHTGNCSKKMNQFESVCREKQENYDAVKDTRRERCDLQNVWMKAQNGNLQLSDLKLEQDCNEPTCEGNHFAVRQCSNFVPAWCWCSTIEGEIIPETFQKDLPDGTCVNLHENKCGNHSHEDIFTKEDSCGLCQCLNGKTTCYEDYKPENGTLSAEQLEKLQEDLLKLFNFQYSHAKNYKVTVDVTDIVQYSIPAPLSQMEAVLSWKFNDHYDGNRDSRLVSTEIFHFESDIGKLTRCTSTSDVVKNEMDTDSDNKITWSEWAGFFAEELRDTPNPSSGFTSSEGSSVIVGKRSIDVGLRQIGRKPLSLRKKFLYTFVDH